MQNHIMTYLIASFLVVSAMGTASAYDTPLWQGALETQLIKDKKCVVKRLEAIEEHKTEAGEIRISVEVYCVDGRIYVATRERAHLKFKLEDCPNLCGLDLKSGAT